MRSTPLQPQCQDARAYHDEADSTAAARVAQRLQDDESRPKAHFGVSGERVRALADPR